MGHVLLKGWEEPDGRHRSRRRSLGRIVHAFPPKEDDAGGGVVHALSGAPVPRYLAR